MKKLLYLGVLFACIFSFGEIAHADNSLPYEPPTIEDTSGNEIQTPDVGNNINETGKVDTEYSSKTSHKVGDKDPLYMYTSYLDTDNPLKAVINSGVQGVFYFAKLMYQMTDWVSGQLDKFDVVNTYADNVFNNGKKIYLNFFKANNPLLYLIALGILWLLTKSYMKGNLPQTMGAIALIFMFNIGYFTLGSKALKEVDTQSTNIVTHLVSKIDITGKPNQSNPAQDEIFNAMVVEPFKSMNFEKKEQYGTNNKNINALLNSENDSSEVAKIRKESGSENLTGNLFGTKFTVALGAVVNNLVYSFVILAFKVAVVFVKTLLLVLFTIAPFVAFLSFFEICQMAMKNLVGKTVVLAVAGTVLGGGVTLFITLDSIIGDALGAKGANPLFLAVAKIFIYYLLWKNKGLIASIFHANISKLGNNRVVQGMNRAFGQAKQKALAPVQQLAFAGGYATSQGLKTLDRKVGRSALRNHGNQKRLGKYKNNLNTMNDSTKDEKERKKAERGKKRFEKRLKKNEKKEKNPYLSKNKKNKLELEKEVNAPVLDAKEFNPQTKDGQELKQLREQVDERKSSTESIEKPNFKGEEGLEEVSHGERFETKPEKVNLESKGQDGQEKTERFVYEEGIQNKDKGKDKEVEIAPVSQNKVETPQKLKTKKEKKTEKMSERSAKKKLTQEFQPNPILQKPSRNPFEEE